MIAWKADKYFWLYDAWGNILGITGSMASTVGAANPIRYRSYYYDTDTGFYYLQSRYYDPAIRRFINADGYVNANGDILGFNMYAYCGNNPVMGYDPTGKQNEWLNELESRWNHVKTFGWRLITSPLKALTVKVGRGEGLGVNIKAKASAIDISVSAESHQSISMVYDKGTLGVEYVNETSIGVELNGISLGRHDGVSHYIGESNCDCSEWDSFDDWADCPANKEYSTQEIEWFSVGVDLGLYSPWGGIYVSTKLDFEAWGKELVDIFNYGLSYGRN